MTVSEAPTTTLPRRAGPPPRTTSWAPHLQLDQLAPPAMHAALMARVFALQGVEERPGTVADPRADFAKHISTVIEPFRLDSRLVGNGNRPQQTHSCRDRATLGRTRKGRGDTPSQQTVSPINDLASEARASAGPRPPAAGSLDKGD